MPPFAGDITAILSPIRNDIVDRRFANLARRHIDGSATGIWPAESSPPGVMQPDWLSTRICGRVSFMKGRAGLTGVKEARFAPQQLRSQRLVTRIVDATARILGEAGPGGLSTNAVADAAEISVGSLYRYFPNKDALVVSVIEREGHRFHDHLRARMDKLEGTPGDILERIVETTIRSYRAIAANDALVSVELRRDGIFDRRTGAIMAIVFALRHAGPRVASRDAAKLEAAAPVLAEIIVALVEAAISRPSASFTSDTVGAISVRAALGYISN